MPRLLALADTQIGVGSVALEDQRAVLDKIVEVALERKVDVVVHGGDLFEGPLLMPEHRRCFIDATEPLRMVDYEGGIPIVILRGNGRHDMATRPTHALDVLREIPGMHISDKPEVFYFSEQESLDEVAVCTLPWVSPANLVAQMNGAVDHDRVNSYAAELLVKIAGDLAKEASERREWLNSFTPRPDLGRCRSLCSVLVAHFAISGSKLPTGLPVDQMREPVLSWADLDAVGYDCIIGAHVHQGQMLTNAAIDKTLGFVIGSPQPLNHGEAGYEHGVWIVEVDATGPTAEFIPIPSKSFVTCTTDAVGAEGLSSGFVGYDFPEGAIIRVRYEATEDESRRIDHGRIRQALLDVGASRVQIEPQIVREARARAQNVSEQISPGEALAAWCETQDVKAGMTERMLATLKEWRS